MEISSAMQSMSRYSLDLSPQEKVAARRSAEHVNQALKAEQTESKAMLAQEDFLALLTTQLKYQDPMKPMDNKDWIAQMANFNSLEANLSMNKKMDSMVQGLSQLAAMDLTGREVRYLDMMSEGIAEGKVEGITVDQGMPYAVINGRSHELGNILTVMAHGNRDEVAE